MAIAAGDIINGYRIIEPIADGGMGSVWKAKHPNLERLVAIKVIKTDLLSAGNVRQLFLDEVRHLSQLHAPQVVQVLDSGVTESNAPFMVTEYLPGVDLATHLERNGALSPDVVCRIGIEVLKALSEAHAMGIIHGDLKPSNIFLMQVQGQRLPVVKVLDFGVASLMDDGHDEESTLGNRIVRGSLQYMSPEQVTLGNLTFASDLYTLGATLYRLLTNHYVFEGESQEQIRQKLSQKAPSVTSRLGDGSCPDALETLVSSCLERKSEDRPSSAQALRKRLEHVQTQIFATEKQVVDTTAVDVSVPDWLQSGFSNADTPSLQVDVSAPQELTLDRSSSLVLASEEPSDITPLLEPPGQSQSSGRALTLDVSRTVEQAAPSITQFKGGSDDEHFSSETVESRIPHPREQNRIQVNRFPYIWGAVTVVLALLGIVIGSWIESADTIEPVVSEPSEIEKTTAQLRDAKALLAKLEKGAPRARNRQVPVGKKESIRQIVLSLPRNQVGRFLNADTQTKLCDQLVMSCRVPRNINVEVRAPQHHSRIFSADKLRNHPAELMSVRLDKRVLKRDKK